MDNIDELLQSSIKTDILQIVYSLSKDETYKTSAAINDLLKIIDKHDL
ncbi:hypothetical protein [Sutcliffiella sp. NC1]|nr:hypothetical protein [Sutcliffiella sp. NC1]WBL16405.1 hypothetical protein O1A01_07165 [Sutcliffiella sp. NC1]